MQKCQKPLSRNGFQLFFVKKLLYILYVPLRSSFFTFAPGAQSESRAFRSPAPLPAHSGRFFNGKQKKEGGSVPPSTWSYEPLGFLVPDCTHVPIRKALEIPVAVVAAAFGSGKISGSRTILTVVTGPQLDSGTRINHVRHCLVSPSRPSISISCQWQRAVH